MYKNMKPTPTPWNVSATHKRNQIVDNARNGYWQFVAETGRSEDAAFIVKVVNEYEGLVSAVENLREINLRYYRREKINEALLKALKWYHLEGLDLEMHKRAMKNCPHCELIRAAEGR